MAQEGGQEIQQSEGISLISTADNLDTHGTSTFSGEPRIIPGLGNVWLTGDNRSVYEERALGIDLRDPTLTPRLANTLQKAGLFSLFVIIDGFAGSDQPLISTLKTPQQRVLLRSAFDFGEDPMETDKQRRWHGSTIDWKKPGDEAGYVIFSPRENNFLSQLRFAFESAPPPIPTPPIPK